MKKKTIVLAMLLLFPCGLVLAARGEGGRDSGDSGNGGGNWGASNGGGRDNGAVRDDSASTNHLRSNGSRFSNSFSNGRGQGYGFSGNGYGFRSYPNHSYSLRSPRMGGTQGRFYGNVQRVPSNLRALGVRRVPFARLNSQMPGHSGVRPSLALPRTGPGGSALRASVVSPGRTTAIFRSRLSTVANSGTLRSKINAYNTYENRRGQYYWHHWNGLNYCHYYDGSYNWYGWYYGGQCFWDCYYGFNWWWYDPGFARWCYWNDGYWWWQDPYNVNVTYLYNNGDYVPANQADNGGSNEGYPAANAGGQPNGPPLAAASQPSQAGEIVFQSGDNGRSVKIMGDSGDAFLFDQASKSFQPVFLESGVTGVRFTGSGRGLKVHLTLKDGTVEVFKADGKPEKGA